MMAMNGDSYSGARCIDNGANQDQGTVSAMLLDRDITHHVDVLIVGFGFSSIPLLRELKRSGQAFTIVSCGMSIWQHLKMRDKLDFDLVSSFHASVLAEDQVKEGTLQDYFPTATWFHEYHEQIYQEFKDQVIDAKVTLVENHHDFSLVQADNGNLYKAQNVVLATGFSRPQNATIKEMDLDTIKNKTVVLNMSGDTSNMMLAKLVPNGNKCVLLSNGYLVLDKLVGFDSPGPSGSHWYVPTTGIRAGKKYRIDLAQMEFHTVENIFPKFWKLVMSMAMGPPGPDSWVSKILSPEVFFNRFPETYRRDLVERNFQGKAGVSNGLIGVKYYAIDMYKLLFGDELEKNIAEGALLNDICFWHTEGLAETWRKNETSVDQANKTIRSVDGRVLSFDCFIDGGPESPNLPKIISVNKDGSRHEFRYRYRENFLGVVPCNLRNIFFMSFTRPTSGGVANITEMQALMIHKLLSDPKKKETMYLELPSLLQKYNEYYYVEQDRDLPTDHLVFYGLYTREVAKFLGIHRPILKSAFSWNPREFFTNLRFEFLFANNAIKYRMNGEYKVPGADDYVRKVFAFNEHNSLIFMMLFSLMWDRLLAYLCVAMFTWKHSLSALWDMYLSYTSGGDWGDQFEATIVPNLAVVLVAAFAIALFERNIVLITLFLLNYNLPPLIMGPKASFQPVAMAYIAWKGEWYWCFAIVALTCLFAFVGRRFYALGISSRYLFGDCKYKYLHRDFWEGYKRAYAKVYEAKMKNRKVA